MTDSGPTLDGRLEEALALVQAWQAQGRRVDLDELVARFPEIPREPLFEELLNWEEVGARLREATPAGVPGDGTAGGASLADYDLGELLGEGGMGTVYRALQRSTGREVAVKVLPSGLARQPRWARRFQREIAAAAALDHPAVVRVHAAGQDGGCLFYAMDLVDGLDLGRLLEARAGRSSPATATTARRILARAEERLAAGEAGHGFRTRPDGLEPARAVLVAWCAEVARGLHAAHEEGIVHRDVKPSNILLDAHGRARIADFGLARPRGAATELTRPGTSPGTPGYMSPEQAAGERGWTSPATDLYSLAATLYHALTGRPPFPPDEAPSSRERRYALPPAPRRLDPSIPRDLEAILLRGLDPYPHLRHPSCAAFAADLEAFLRGEPVWARPLPLPFRVARRMRRQPRRFLLGSAAALAAALLLAAPVWLRAEQRLGRRLQDDLKEGRRRAAEARQLLAEGNAREAEARRRGALTALRRAALEGGGRRPAQEALAEVVGILTGDLELEQASPLLEHLDRGVDEARARIQASRWNPGAREAVPGEPAPRARVRTWLNRWSWIELAEGASAAGATPADVLDGAGRAGQDGRAELLFLTAQRELVAWTGTGRIRLAALQAEGRETPGPGAPAGTLQPAIAARACGPGEAPVLVVVLEGVLHVCQAAASVDPAPYAARALPLRFPEVANASGWSGHLALGMGRGEQRWAVVATDGWDPGGDDPWSDVVVDLVTGEQAVLPGSGRSVTRAVAAVDADGDGVEEILCAHGEWRGFGLALYRQEESGAWRLARAMRLGVVSALVPLDEGWLVACKEDLQGSDARFDSAAELGLPRGLYLLRPVRDVHGSLDLEIPALRADLALPRSWSGIHSLVRARLGSGEILVLARLGLRSPEDPAGTGRPVLLAWLLPGEPGATPDLHEGRLAFRIDGAPVPGLLLGAADLDGDGGEEILATVQGEPTRIMILGGLEGGRP